MKKRLLLPAILGASLVATSCASHDHQHDEVDQAGHSHGQNSQMMGTHSSSQDSPMEGSTHRHAGKSLEHGSKPAEDHHAKGHHGSGHHGEGHHGGGHHGEGHHGEGHHGEGHHGGGHHGMNHGNSLAGRPGKESEVDRTIAVEANDSMSFIHKPFKVKTGETIKFEITNTGAIPHEFSIGTKSEHMVHGKMMMANPDMHHGPGGSSITIAPGKTEVLIWRFEEAKDVQAACNIPGHYQAGMHSDIEF